ncbi:hypothetical protein [Caballeronia sp. HLA56]
MPNELPDIQMKKFLAALLVGFASIAFGATLTPIQLLNPAGSTAGQVIISNGPTTASAWGAVTLTGITGTLGISNGGTGANHATSALANLRAAPFNSPTFTGTPTVPGYLTTTSAASTYAPIASPTFTGTPAAPTPGVVANSTTLATTAWVRLLLASPGTIGNTAPNTGAFTTLSASGALTPSRTAGIVGTTTNNNANAGSVGEIIENTATGVAINTTGVSQTLTSVSLTAGDWDVTGSFQVTPAATTVVTSYQAGIALTNNALPGFPNQIQLTQSKSAGVIDMWALPTRRVSVAAGTTVYLTANIGFTTSTCAASVHIRARRVR